MSFLGTMKILLFPAMPPEYRPPFRFNRWRVIPCGPEQWSIIDRWGETRVHDVRGRADQAMAVARIVIDCDGFDSHRSEVSRPSPIAGLGELAKSGVLRHE